MAGSLPRREDRAYNRERAPAAVTRQRSLEVAVSPKTRSVVLLVLGVLLFLVALTADSLGLGSQPGLGIKQISAAVAGVIVAAFGMLGLRKAKP